MSEDEYKIIIFIINIIKIVFAKICLNRFEQWAASS